MAGRNAGLAMSGMTEGAEFALRRFEDDRRAARARLAESSTPGARFHLNYVDLGVEVEMRAYKTLPGALLERDRIMVGRRRTDRRHYVVWDREDPERGDLTWEDWESEEEDHA